ncbi:MAG TPA: AraC family transcriptional regulator [Lachnospiraceae bacterium]|nr:AraC family transcriptional regulator [Lachnospiraceae bacterium]
MIVKEAERKRLKETYQHGTAEMPFSLHHTVVPSGQSSILYLHWHNEFEFLFIQSGGALFTIENETIELHENEAVFINANQLHYAKALNGLPCEFYAIVFHPAFLFGNVNSVSFLHYVKPILTYSLSYPQHIANHTESEAHILTLIKDISAIYGSNLHEYELLLRGKLLELWHILYHSSKPMQKSSKVYQIDRLQSVIDYIHIHYSDDITIEELAKLIPLSQGQFCRSFKEAYGITPITYLNKIRILKSCELLSIGKEKVAEIATLTGFNNVSYYNRTFLSVIGCTPSQYQKALLK